MSSFHTSIGDADQRAFTPLAIVHIIWKGASLLSQAAFAIGITPILTTVLTVLGQISCEILHISILQLIHR
jgi:hypothetical protein